MNTLEIQIIRGSQPAHIKAQSIDVYVADEGAAKILPNHASIIALCESENERTDISAKDPTKKEFLIDEQTVSPILTAPFLTFVKQTSHNTENNDPTPVVIIAPEIPGFPPLPPSEEKVFPAIK